MRNKIVQLIFLVVILSAIRLSAQNKKIKIACMGNSVTYGYTLPDPSTQSYPALLQKKLGEEYEVRNFGHSGATLLKKGHNPYYKTKEFAEAMNFHADIAIIHLGLNDTDPRDWPNYRDDFIPDYNWLIDTLRAVNPAVKIYICTMTPIFTGHPRFMSSTFTWYREVQQLIPEIARINHAGLIDLYEAFHDRPDLITDANTVHPNTGGAEKLCEVIYKNITGDFGGLQVADIFTDNMVMQRSKPVPVWGIANAGTSVKVIFNKQEKTVITQPDGKWKVLFPAMSASDQPHTLQIENEGKKSIFRNILIGDVWLCSGQSNMEFSLAEANGGKETAATADEKQELRLFKYNPYAETGATPWDSLTLAKADELDFFHGEWKLNNENAAREFSAVGYWFGKKIQEEEHIPIGLIEVAVGGSPLISWLGRLTLEADPLFEPALHNWRHSDYIMDWCRKRADLNLKNARSPFQRHPYDPCFNFEAGISHITQFPIKGAVWYQGESDADNAELYNKLFPVFVKDWREHWGYDFPFYYVQLSSLDRPSWNYFRDGQRRLLKEVPNAGMAVSSDLGDSVNVHYINKQPVGLRLADLALHDTYGKTKVVPNGPLVVDARKEGNKIALSFSEETGLTTSDGQPLRGFEILNGKGYFQPSKAVIRNNKVLLEIPPNETVEKIVYGWKPYTRANLVNGAGLPASTFMVKVKNGEYGIQAEVPSLIPLPQSLQWTNVKFPFSECKTIIVNNASLMKVAADLQHMLAERGRSVKIKKYAGNNLSPVIELVQGKVQAPLNSEEAYMLEVSAKKVIISANTPHGIFNGIQTLRQMMREEVFIPGCHIRDWPAFSWRGYMVDVGRNYQSVRQLKQQIDIMAHYKLNVFHFHLTENIAWRLQVRQYPQLTSPENMLRDKGKYYSVGDMRDLIAYCRDRFITLVPEIDMPGHSDAFTRTFGTNMQSEKGLSIVKNILAEVDSTYDLPYIHIGADEVKFTNKDFVPEVVKLIHEQSKRTIGWDPGGNYDNATIRQLWANAAMENGNIQYIDSRSLYLNHMDPLESVVSIFERQLGDVNQENGHILGGEICLWNDRRVADEKDLLRMNPVYPAMLAFAERSWRGNGFPGAVADIGKAGSERAETFKEFENRLIDQQIAYFKNLPFPYVRQSNIQWKLFGPFANGGDLQKKFWPEIKGSSPEDSLADKTAIGATIILRHWWYPALSAWLDTPEENTTWYGLTRFRSNSDTTAYLWIGFNDFSRSPATDEPQAGEWDDKQSCLWLNGELIPPPHWNHGGEKGNAEIPLSDEGYSYRAPTIVQVKKGWNNILVKAPVGSFKGKDWQNPEKWMFTVVPVSSQ